MAEGRPVLLGLDNPLSDDPAHALYPHPPGCAGHRLLQMLQLADRDFTETDYLRYFDRRNLSPYPAPRSKRELEQAWGRVASECRQRTIVCLGVQVAEAAGVREPGGSLMPEACRLYEHPGGVLTAWIPHPSGRNRVYNRLEERRRVGVFLRGLVRRG